MILVLVMVFSLMPVLSAGRAIAAKQSPEGDVVCRRTQSADVYFEMLDNRDGKPIDVDKIKEKKGKSMKAIRISLNRAGKGAVALNLKRQPLSPS